MKKKKLILISFLSIICLTACILIASLCSKGDNNDYNEAPIKPVEKLGYYNSDLFPIERAEKTTKNVVELSTLYSIGENGVVSVTGAYTSGFTDSSVINISSENDLYAFSYLCNEYVSNGTYPFLAYSYQLTQNIDYSDCLYSFLPIGYTSNIGFSGIFNGNGYEIENLKFESITTTNQEKYNNIEYYAMFTLVAEDAQISNFGIINPFIDNLVKPENLVGTSVIAGVNYGHIGYVFVKDLRDIEEDAGINAAGQGRISLLVGKNGSSENKVGSIENCYVAATIVVSFQNTEYLDFNELLVENYADISNLYYYNKSITKYTSHDATEDVEYLGIGIAYNGRVKYGTRCGSEKELTETLLALNGNYWKDETSYGVDSSTFDIATPITRGMDYDIESKTFYIDDEMDFAYMYELMRESSYFASNQITYEIRSNIDLSLLNPDAYYYGKAIAATIKGKVGSYESVYFSNSQPSSYPTIFDPVFKNYALNEGVECYGVFPYLSGVIQDLNIAITSPSYSLSHVTTSSNTKSIGFVSGLIEGGLVNNVNVFASSVELNDNVNRYYFGSIAGIISGGAAIQNVTASLSFSDGTQGSINGSIAYDKGIALGGIVGFIAKTYANVYDALSCVNFNLNLNSACEVSVGGIIGSGYTRNYNGNKTSQLENRGSIVINSGASATNLYASGIIAHQLGMQDEVTLFNNIGDITLNSTGTANTYVSGISNVDLASSSNLKERGIVKYSASGFTNASNINITSSTGNVYYAGVLNLNSTSFTSSIDNMYNLGYKAISGNNTYLDPQSIEMSAASTYAGVINNIGGSTNYKVNAEIVYNFRDIIIKNDSAVSGKELSYSAVMLGGNINYIDVRNEGNIDINLISAFNNTNTLNVMGVFDTLSLGCSASEIYNGGNITITDKSSSTKNLNINVSGIARLNNAVIEDLEQNPLDVSFDNTLVGSLDKAINNGNILITSDNYDKDTVTANNSSLTNLNLVGDINASGIVNTNSGIISNVFNLGDITLDIYATTATDYNAGGIVCEQDGEYAQIRDTANNGELQLINMSLNAATLNAGGIVAKNDSTGSNINQIISFSINYGSVLVFNANDNMALADAAIDGTNAMASGILGVGFCNTVNVVNYGNIYSSEAAGGMICIADLQAFDNSEANLANTLNYGNIYAIRKYYSDASAGGNLVYLTYNKIISLNSNYIFAGDQTIQKQYIGAIVSLIRYSSNSLNIRYLINFYQATAIVARELNSPSQAIDTSNFITTRGSADTFGGGSIKYAPLSTISDELGNIGVFSDEFVFHQAINGIGLDESKVTDKYITDYFAFIRFDKINDTLLDKIGWRAIAYGDAATQFARNLTALSTLLDKAGYNSSSSLISDAMNSRTWLSSCDFEIIKSVITESLASGELTDEDLKSILNYMLFDSESQTVITSSLRSNIISGIIEYYDLENTDYYTLLQSLLYDELLAKIVAEEDANYKAVLTKIQSIISTASDTELESVLNGYINALLADDSNEILSPLFNEYNDYYLTKKMNLVNTLISGYSEDTLQKMYDSLSSGSSSTSADSLKYQMYLQEHPTEAVEIYSNLFTMNSTSNNEYYQEALNSMLSKYNIVDTIDNDDSFSISNMDDTNTALSGSAYINGTAQAYEKNYTELWNLIKNDKDLQSYISTNYFSSIKNPTDGLNYSALIAKATEYNNTYQTQDAPSTYGSKQGVFRTTSLTGDIRNRFIYTPDSVNNITTYYYGPFNYDGSIWNNSTMSSKNPPYNQGYDIYANQAISGTQKTYFPFFISTNKKITENQIAQSNTTSSFGYRTYIWNDLGKSGGTSSKSSAGQWVSDYILQKRADDVTAVLYKNYNTGEYIVDNYDFSPNKVYRQDSTNSSTVISEADTVNYSPIDGSNITLTENNIYNHSAKISTGNPYESDFLKGYATSDIITGIWCMFDLWYEGGAIGAYITSKTASDQDGVTIDDGHTGVHTTQYTYYQIVDLVKLDGVRTKGKNTGTDDTDEISIISALMTQILSTDAGKEVVLRALASYSSSNTINNNNISNMITSAIRGTDVAGQAITEVFATLDSTSLENITYSNTQTLKQHFDSLIKDVEYTTAQNIALFASSDIESFKKLLEIVFTNIPDNDSGNVITSKDTQYFLYKYVAYLKENGYTNEQILEAINSANATDLEAFIELSKFDFDYTITTSDLAEITGTSYIFYKFDVVHTGVITINGTQSQDHGDTASTSTWIIPANTNIDISGDGDIMDYELYGVNSITTGTDSMYYVLELTFTNGNITINGSRQLASEGENVTAEWVLQANTTYNIETDGTYPEISDAKIYRKNEIELVMDSTVEVKFTGSVTIDGVTNTHASSQTANWDLTAGTYSVVISEGTSIEYLNYPMTYNLPTVTYRMGDATGTGSNVTVTSGEVQSLPITTSQTYTRTSTTVYTYGTLSFNNVPTGSTISLELTANNNYNITTTNSFSDGVTGKTATIDSYNGESWFFRGSADNRTLSQIKITYTLVFGSDTITYTQYLFDVSNANSTSITGTPATITNYILDDGNITTINNSSLSITGLENTNHTCLFVCSDGTNVSPADLNVSNAALEANMYTPVDFTTATQYADLSDIEDRYNAYYTALSQIGKYIVDSTLVSKSVSTSSFTIDEPSIILVKTSNSGGTIKIDGISKTATGQYVAFYVTENKTYNIETTNATITEVLVVNNDSVLTVTGNELVEFNNGDINEIIFTGTNYTYLSNYDLQIATNRSDMIAAIDVLFPSMFNDSNLYNSNKEYYIFDKDIISGFTNDELKSIIILLAQASYNDESSILGKLVANLASEYYDDLILEYEELNQYAVNKIWDIAQADEASYEDITKLLLAAYIGDDYLDCDNKLLSSKIYSILNSYSSGNYQYIISNTTVDSDKFIELIIHLGITSNIDGFGIYALSASTGIKDGIFIPDNFDLTEMDAKYDITSDSIVLSDTELSDWREKNSDSSEDSSVNHAFDKEMKQLKKSIATTIFTLNLGATDSSGNSLVLYSSPELIDLDNHVITYYIPKNLSISSSLTINKLSMAHNATANKQVGSVLVFTLSNNTYTLTDAIKVTAEDENEVASYTIIIEKVDMSFSLTPSESTVADGNLELNVTSPKNGGVGKLPANLDLTPFITIKDSTSNVVDSYNAADACYTYFELSMEEEDHIIDQNGSAVITMHIFDTLKAGTYTLTLSIYGMTETVTFIKPENVGNSITDVQFDGKQVELLAGQTVTSYVPFGIAYDDTDLENYLYLDYEPTISPGATASIAVSKGDLENSVTIYYEIVYTITSESGITAVYTHRLQELDPFSVGNSYVDLFKDGASEGTYTYLASNNQITASYSRDEGAPTYRVKFIMDNFFYGDTTSFTHTPEAEVGVAVDSALSEGISVTISQNADPKTYSYSYVYDSYGSWNGEEYHRTYTFPALKITKEASKDASLSKLTFLDDYSRLSGANTIVNPNYAMLPENPNDDDQPYKDDNIDENEYYYETVKGETPKKITVGSNTINYASSGNDYSTHDTTSDYYTNHFYALGIVSNTELGYYAPTFAIEEHAEIYQYITQTIINNYGASQTKTDTEILNDMSSTIYIYVPFVKEAEKDYSIENKNITTLLVKLDNGLWTDVYQPSFYTDGSAALGNMNGSKNTVIQIDGVNYVVDSSAGKPTENQSLNMDYIGTPKANHFWYVSYIVLSESYLTDENIGTDDFDNPYYKAYHISIIDQSNNVYYEVSIKAPAEFNPESLYLNINVNKYDEDEVFIESQQISAYANKDEESKYDGYSSYSLERSLQILPSGYYYFYIALPEGYSARYKTSKANTNENESESGAYQPPSSIVTQRIELEIEIYANDESDGTVWGVSTQTNYIRLIIAAEE